MAHDTSRRSRQHRPAPNSLHPGRPGALAEWRACSQHGNDRERTGRPHALRLLAVRSRSGRSDRVELVSTRHFISALASRPCPPLARHGKPGRCSLRAAAGRGGMRMYDYIIVGAGSAGCVLANRLSEDPSVSVLLLEAGKADHSLFIRVPIAASLLYKGPYDWAFETEPQPQLNDRRLYFARGKGLGGSSTINSMIYIRGAPQDYDQWAALGNPGWSFAEVLPYFKKLEQEERGASAYHGVDGPLHVADPRFVHPLTRAFLEAALAVGYVCNEDFNGATQEGVGLYQVTHKAGQRHSAADAYLKPVRHRRNLTTITNARVMRLQIEGDHVVGVTYLRNGRLQGARAGREILLCGGAIHSPQLLMLSGVGPAEHLQSLGIPVVRDVPGVGQNLQDHVAIGVMCSCARPISLNTAVSPWNLPRNLLRYVLFRQGPLTSNVLNAAAFVRSLPDLPFPDLQLNFLPIWVLNHGLTRLKRHAFIL